MANMVDHLDLAIGLYRNDGSGELRPEKLASNQRTFDEHNAFATYRALISNHYTGVNAEGNREGLARLKYTRERAKTISDQLYKYLDGTPVRWTRGGFPYVNFYCNDNQVLARRNSEGRTYTEDTGEDDSVFTNTGARLYWVLMKQATQKGRETWVMRKAVCDADPDDPDYDTADDASDDGSDDSSDNGSDSSDDDSEDGSDNGSDNGPDDSDEDLPKRFGIPVEKRLNAYTYKAIFGAVEETMVFCPAYHERWLKIEADRLASGTHYRNMHVGIGKKPTDEQKTSASLLLADPDFDPKSKVRRGISWFGDFLVQVLIHESTHAEAFTGVGNALVDVICRPPAGEEKKGNMRTTSLACLRAVVRGDDNVMGEGHQGHKDAEGFAMYAMATWVNTVAWYSGFNPKERVDA
ncbi:hypothetical protein FPOAC2_13045 [Fusarium poae]